MFSISYQVVYNERPDFKELVGMLKESFEEYMELDDDTANTIINIQYSKQLSYQNKFIVGFSLSFDEVLEVEEFIEKIISSFNEQLKNHEVDAVFKYYDGILFSLLQECYYNIFKIEMKLREIITFIYVDTYKDDFYDLMKEININPQYPKKREIDVDKRFKGNLSKDVGKREEYLSTFLENEFFYILFMEYKQVSAPKNLQHNDLIEIVKYSDNFDNFKTKLLNRGVTDTQYVKFLEEIKIYVDNLGNIRNSIAHNRTPSNAEISNLNRFLTKIEEKIDEFLENVQKTYNPYATTSILEYMSD